MTELERLIDEIRASDRMGRIAYRDRLAAFGTGALPALRAWLADPEFAAFAVRVLHQIGLDRANRRDVIRVLADARTTTQSPAVLRDIEAEMTSLGQSLTAAVAQPRVAKAASLRAVRVPSSGASRATRWRTPAREGKPGRRYWAMRTSDTRPNLIWSEIRRGKLRQGWGRSVEEDLRVIEGLVAAGRPLSTPQTESWRAHKMLGASQDGVTVGDLIVTQNMPQVGRLSVCRVVGPYTFEFPDSIFDYGHVLPIELVVDDIARADARVSDALRKAVALPQRLYEITRVGGEVEALVEAAGMAGLERDSEEALPA